MKTADCYEVVEGLSDTKLHFYSRHFACTNGVHRLCEYTLEAPVNLAGAVKTWTVLLGFLALLNGFLSEMTLLLCFVYGATIFVVMNKILSWVTKESVLIEMEMVGVQLTTQYWFGWKVTEIINREDVIDIVINEAITMGEIIFYLAVIMKNDKLKPLFSHTKPRLYCLKKIYEEIQEILKNR